MSRSAKDSLQLKFKGTNKAFAPFSAISDVESLCRTWKVASRVSEQLDEGDRVENLAWRLWHLHAHTVVTPKHGREFKKMSKTVGERLDKDKGKGIRELGLPDVPAPKDADKKFADRLKLKQKTRRLSKNDGSAASMMHTFELDPTVGIPKTTRSGSSTSASSASGLRPAVQPEQTSRFDQRVQAPPANHGYVPQPPAALQRAPSIPSSLRMTPNSSRRNSFARPSDSLEENLPPPYPSNHPFARQQGAPASFTPHQSHTLSPFQPQQQLNHIGGPIQQLPMQSDPSAFLANLVQSQQLSAEQLSILQNQQAQQVVTSTLNQLWSQLGCGTGGQQDVDMLSLATNQAGAMNANNVNQQTGSTPTSSSDVSSPENIVSPATNSSNANNVPANFHFAQRVTGMAGLPDQGLSTFGGGGGPGPGGLARRSSQSDYQAGPYRRPSLSQQSSGLQSSVGSPAANPSLFVGRPRLNSNDSTSLSRRGSFASRRRESMNHQVGGNTPTSEAQQTIPSVLPNLNTNWSQAGTPSGDLASGFLGIEITSPIDDTASRLARAGHSTDVSPKSGLAKGRSHSSSSFAGYGGRPNLGMSSLSNITNLSSTTTPLAQTTNAAHLSVNPQGLPSSSGTDWSDSNSSVFYDDVPMDDTNPLEKQRRRASDSNTAQRPTHSLRDQLREMQLQHQSYQQAAAYAATLESFVPPPTPASQQAQTRTSPSALGSFHSPSDISPSPHVPSPINGNDTVFPSLQPSTPSSNLMLNSQLNQRLSTSYLDPNYNNSASSDFSFSQPPSLDDLGSLFNDFLTPDSNLPSVGTALLPVTEGEEHTRSG